MSLNPQQLELLETEMNFDDLRAEFESQIEPEPEVEIEPEVEMSAEDQIRDRFYSIPNGPSPETVEAWKSRWGNEGVFVVSIAEADTYVLRYITSAEWEAMQKFMKEMSVRANGNEQMLSDIDTSVKKKVIETCCLWPKIDDKFFTQKRAGLLDQLHYVVMMNSYFFCSTTGISFYSYSLSHVRY